MTNAVVALGNLFPPHRRHGRMIMGINFGELIKQMENQQAPDTDTEIEPEDPVLQDLVLQDPAHRSAPLGGQDRRMLSCGTQHTIKTRDNGWILGDNVELIHRTYERRPTHNYFYARCLSCGTNSNSIPKRVFKMWSTELTPVTEHITRRSLDNKTCSVEACNRIDIDMHHFAPKETFGWEVADQWPILPLCVPHHQEWHRKMTGYRSPGGRR